jgi:hypothetical protein
MSSSGPGVPVTRCARPTRAMCAGPGLPRPSLRSRHCKRVLPRFITRSAILTRLGRCADAGTCRKGDRPVCKDLVHDVPDRAGAAPTRGAAPQAAIDLAGTAHAVFGGNGPHLVVRNDIARTYDHDSTPTHLFCGNASHAESFQEKASRVQRAILICRAASTMM